MFYLLRERTGVEMNERIRELWDKAAESTAAFPSGQNNSWETQVNFIEKFAELIVKECADKCLAMAYVAPGPHHYAAMIKEHFGVEE
jgi:hypothetical protein